MSLPGASHSRTVSVMLSAASAALLRTRSQEDVHASTPHPRGTARRAALFAAVYLAQTHLERAPCRECGEGMAGCEQCAVYESQVAGLQKAVAEKEAQLASFVQRQFRPPVWRARHPLNGTATVTTAAAARGLRLRLRRRRLRRLSDA